MAPNATALVCTKLDKMLLDFSEDEQALDKDADDGHRFFLGILEEACNLARATDRTDPDFADIVARISQTLNGALDLAYGKVDFDFLPSFAHSEDYPLLKGPRKDKHIFPHRMKELLELMERMMAKRPAAVAEDDSDERPRLPDPWQTTPRLHPLSTPLSRFEADAACPSGASLLVRAIYEARCEISSDRVNFPINIINTGSCLAMPSSGGYKSRSPLLTYYLFDDSADGDFPLQAHHASVGLSDIAYSAAGDDQRKLIFTGEIYKKGLPRHTLSTSEHHGPISVLPSGRFLRTGKGSAGVWNIEELKTHGPRGNKRVGSKYDTSGSWRDEDEVIEDSSGSKPTSVIKFADAKLTPATWHLHPNLPGTMLCGQDPKKSGDYSCFSLDLEHGGTVVDRYLGHGGEIDAFSTSDGDPNVFLTAAGDGHVRLYDVRLTLPVLSLCPGSGSESCRAGVIVHPDGVPTIFTGAARDEVIRLWDVRARKMVYELSTGNSEVTGMTWDAKNSALYVSTNCEYMDRNGYTNDYRKAHIPKDARHHYDSTPCWPNKAEHAEDYFGHVFDAGNHRIFRYAFKDQADPSILPEYGDATTRSAPYW
ncbi:hypothetical protein B0H10DRAFT_1984790 [Mycena sp. CBHHK59/15]|nr:hypothetical protein B0H10DRAFT_1984790 [Mycena sp. CBHHK59/15]